MSKKIVFATANEHKTAEVAKILAPAYEVLNLKSINCDYDIPETGSTFADNATLKSIYVAQNYQLDCFADDSGLEVEALNSEPGIYSARYSGVKDDMANLQFLLGKMQGKTNRKAQFRTVISLMKDGENHLFEGVIKGRLTEAPVGNNGFGYDPIFIPNGYDITFAQMSMDQKNRISHRALAMKKLIAFLKAQQV